MVPQTGWEVEGGWGLRGQGYTEMTAFMPNPCTPFWFNSLALHLSWKNQKIYLLMLEVVKPKRGVKCAVQSNFMHLSYLKKCRRSSYEAVHTRNTSPGSKHVIDFIFNSPKYIFVSPVLRRNQLYQVSATVTFCNSISIMPFLILEKTCKQQAYRKAYWPSPNVVYFPVRVYSRTLSGTHCCPPRMT